ncbi:hypothetical protein ANN_06259 [Periplaneta americana]|uniref:Uncharacterized protein n=1 Tax=Periplaneta americana TaxID=6978 RepID=A0ABQ8TFC3_PERAM|nr:hypothetical protein ANN_06259 [Periplaneta americana]
MLCRQRFEEIGQTEWENVCRKVEEIELEYCEKDGIVEERIERIVIEDNGMESRDEDNECENNPMENEDEDMSGVEDMEDD